MGQVQLNNKRNNKMLKDLVRLANHLDANGLMKEADLLDRLLFKMAAEDSYLWSGRSAPVNDYSLELPKEVMDFLGEGYEGLVVAEADEGYLLPFSYRNNWIKENNFYRVEHNEGKKKTSGTFYHLYENKEGLRVAELDINYTEDYREEEEHYLIIPKIHAAPTPPEGFVRDEGVEELNFDSDMDAGYLGLKRGPTYDPLERGRATQRILDEQY